MRRSREDGYAVVLHQDPPAGAARPALLKAAKCQPVNLEILHWQGPCAPSGDRSQIEVAKFQERCLCSFAGGL